MHNIIAPIGTYYTCACLHKLWRIWTKKKHNGLCKVDKIYNREMVKL